ncbi:MAG: ABC transporter permease [Polyangiales bacterium]
MRTGIFIASLVAIWAAASRSVDATLLPGPDEVLRALWANARAGMLHRAVLKSLGRLALGYSISLTLGVTLGIALARVRAVKETLGALVLGLQALPSVCWLPLALLWFGLGEAAILTVVVLGSLLSVAVATEGAVNSIPAVLLRAARTMGAEGIVLWRRVILPAALPGVLSGARLGWTFAWRSLLAGELLFVSGGVGQVLEFGRELHDMALVMGVMLVIVALGLASDRLLFGLAEARVRRAWGLDRA